VNAPEADRSGSDGADRLLANKECVPMVWVERVRREVPAAELEAYPLLIDTLPVMLDQLAEALSPHHPRRTATQGSTSATEHGGERVRVTRFRLEDVVREYSILRQILFEVLDDKGRRLTAEERATVNASLDQALMDACAGYALVQSSFRDQLFAIVAHDLRNPLHAAHASASLIQHRPTAEHVCRAGPYASSTTSTASIGW
jgi:signal transduction histidine kinase